MGHRLVRLVAVVAVSTAALALQVRPAHAQAWVADPGQLGLDIDYNFSTSNKIVTDTTMSYEDAGTTGHQITASAEYVLLEHLALSASLPVVMLQYTGSNMFPHAGGGRYDDGSYHTTLTDLRAGVRYQVLDEPFAIAPHVAFSIPVADYETVGNTVAGRHLKMLHVGLSGGYLFSAATYAHVAYEFTLAEKYDRTVETAQHSQNRSDASLLVGHKLLDYRLDLHLGANLRRTHGGVNFSELEAGALSNNEALYHDAILDEDVFLVGAGVGYDLSDTVTATLDGRIFISELSQNTLNASVFALGVSWSPL